MNYIFIVVFWILLIKSFFDGGKGLIKLLFFVMPFGSFAVIPPELTGGTTILAGPIVAMFFVFSQLISINGLNVSVAALSNIKALLLLFLFWLVALLVTLFLPGVFNKEVLIVPVNLKEAYSVELLGYSVQNITQFLYLTISILTVFSIVIYLRCYENYLMLIKAVCSGSVVLIITGFLDLVLNNIGLEYFLDPLRTAEYSLLANSYVGDIKRVVGVMPEASSFGSLCISFMVVLYFFRRCLKQSFLRDLYIPILIVLLLLFVVLSTSSAAYVGLFVFVATCLAEWIFRYFFLNKQDFLRRSVKKEFNVAFFMVFCFVLLFLMVPDLFDVVLVLFNEMVFNKMQTSSFDERSMWSMVSLQALYDTYMLGVGLGGTRASSSIVALFSNVGLFGGVIYLLFILKSYMLPVYDSYLRLFVWSARWSAIPILAVGALVSTTANFGLFLAVLWGIITAGISHTYLLKYRY
nr:hypothetical protein [uncultured Amphritea sp.]